MMRNCLSIAITEIAKETFNNATVIMGEVCAISSNFDNNETVFARNGYYDWSEQLQGFILSSFYWGYICTQVPGGMFTEKFGGKNTFLVGMILSTVLTALTPLSIIASGPNAELLILLRVVLGMSQGIIIPATYSLMAVWIPLKERARAFALGSCGVLIGCTLSSILSGLLLQHIEGWQSPFYIFSILGLLWSIVFVSTL